MKTNKITDIVINTLSEKSFPVFATTVSGAGLHEADVLGINRTGYIHEFEIKTSRADFRADFQKTYKHYNLKNKKAIHKFKEWVNGKKTNNDIVHIIIPNRFYYVCIDGLIKPDEVPEYAGLYYITKFNSLKEVKKAPLLHRNKANIHLYQRIASILSQRILYGCSYYTYKQKQAVKANKKLLDE